MLVIEINTFRLIYKILEKLKKHEPQSKELMQCLGSEVLRRVKNLKAFCCDGDENCSSKVKLGLFYGVK